jgi:hypothetical protein
MDGEVELGMGVCVRHPHPGGSHLVVEAGISAVLDGLLQVAKAGGKQVRFELRWTQGLGKVGRKDSKYFFSQKGGYDAGRVSHSVDEVGNALVALAPCLDSGIHVGHAKGRGPVEELQELLHSGTRTTSALWSSSGVQRGGAGGGGCLTVCNVPPLPRDKSFSCTA